MTKSIWSEDFGFTTIEKSEEDAAWKRRFVDEVEKETDRGKVLTIVSFIDELLIGILMAFSPNKEHAEKLLGDLDGCLSSIMHRANIALLLSLIRDVEFKSIQKLARIRNEFAHTWDGTSFDNEKISKIVRSFPPELFIDIDGSNKAKFMRVSSYVIQEILDRSDYAKSLSCILPSVYRDCFDLQPEERRRYLDIRRHRGKVTCHNAKIASTFFDVNGEFLCLKIKLIDPAKPFVVSA